MNKLQRTQRIVDLLQRRAAGRKLLVFWDWYLRHRAAHLTRYHTGNQRAYRIKSWLVAGMAVLIFLSSLMAVGLVGRHFYRHHQEMHCQTQAGQFMERGDYRNAALSVQRLLALNPSNPVACRLQAELADRNRSPQTLKWLQRLVQINPTVENKLLLASAGLKYEPAPYPIAGRMLTELASSATNNAGYHVIAANLAMRTSRLAEAKAHFETALLLDPTNQVFRMSVAVLKMTMTNQQEQSESRLVLKDMQDDEQFGFLVSRSLVADRILKGDWAGAKLYSDRLVSHPQANMTDQVQNLVILKKLGSNTVGARLQFVKKQAATNALAVAELSAWMQANGSLSENLEWLTDLPNAMLDQIPVQIALSQGYLQNQKWMPMLKVAMQGNWSSLEYLRLAMISKAWSQLGGAGLAESSWNQAMSLATRNRETMFRLLHLTDSLQLPEQRRSLLAQVVEKFPEERWADQELERLYFEKGETLALYQLYAILNKRYPSELAYQNNLAATALLLNKNVAESRQWAVTACEKYPTNSSVATTYAFALHLQGRDKQGLAVLQKLASEELSKPSVAIYYGLLLASAGKIDEAKSWLNLAAQGRLLPEEKSLLSSALEPPDKEGSTP